MWWNDWERAVSTVLLSIPAALAVAIVALAVTRAGSRRVGIAGVVASGGLIAILAAPIALQVLVPPPFEPAFAGGAGLDLRGVGILVASWLSGAIYLGVGIVGFALLVHLTGRRGRRKALPKQG